MNARERGEGEEEEQKAFSIIFNSIYTLLILYIMFYIIFILFVL